VRVKKLDLSTSGVRVVVLNDEDASKLNLYGLDRVKIKKRNRCVIAILDISDGMVKKGEVGCFKEVSDSLNLKNRDEVKIEYIKKPRSIYYIKEKLDGKVLDKPKINEIVKDLVEDGLSEIEVTYFVSGCYRNGLNLEEVSNLTKAIVKNSKRLKLGKKVVDKHGIGGVPNNRTSMIIVPILAAAGLIVPKTSSRAITSPSGTSDTMEMFSNVDFTVKEIEKIVRKTNGCLVWGGTKELASADDKLIKIERPLSLDPEGIMLASIMSKKFSVGAKKLLIDIPVGKTAKIKNMKKALHLKNRFINLGKKLGMKVKVLISDGRQPVGNGVGVALEARDVLRVLKNEGVEDLKEKSVLMAGIILEMSGFKNGKEKALEILESGDAYDKFKEIVKAQKGKVREIKLSKIKYDFKSSKNGKVVSIDNKMINQVCRILGCPRDKESGMYLDVKVGNKVINGQILFSVYAKNRKKLKESLGLLKKVIKID
tara:strand:+ start:2155 stop:3603 length:1449 start_codon:yes stop_codon:yes gene_type:complete